MDETALPRTTPLLLGFHCHQPVGNFDSVLRHACARCYGPLLETLAGQPGFRFSLHLSGPLLEWMEKQERSLHRLVGELARRGQAELLTSGFYEPVLASLPRRDALAQVRLFSQHLESLSGVPPRGLWLTERVWEAALVPLLAEAGVEYALVDDNHFRASGLAPEQLGGRFLTEFMGEGVSLFPISKELRYLVPFHPVGEVLAHLRALPAGGAGILFDDGEKFGLWPGTDELVFGKGWLQAFLGAVQEEEGLATMTFSQHLDLFPPRGKVHLPPGSYLEMEEWTLPPGEGLAFRRLWSQLSAEGRGEEARRFLRGGTWLDFFRRYPESDDLHQKMLGVSRRLAGRDLPRAARNLYRGQCNDAYWHGIFGGLYLPVLRDGVTRALNEAERELDRALGLPAPVVADLDGDGHPEAELRTPEAIVRVSSRRGGQLVELSDKSSLFNLLGTLARRPELYHFPLQREGHLRGEGEVATIHEAERALTAEQRASLAYDWYPRHAFIDHLMAPGATLAAFARCEHPEWGDFVNQPYTLSLEGQVIRACRDGGAFPPGRERVPFRVEKGYHLAGRSLVVRLRAECGGKAPLSAVLACEVNLHLPSGESAAASCDGILLPLDRPQEWEEAREVALLDPALAGQVRLASSLPGRVWSFPVRTVSQSEVGFDHTCQGICLAFCWELEFLPGRPAAIDLSLTF